MFNRRSCNVHYLKASFILTARYPLLSISFLLLFPLFFISCGPAIHSFQVDQQTITAADSIKANWDVSGKPTLLIHENNVSNEENAAGGIQVAGGGNGQGQAGTIHSKFMELTLVAQKNGKEKRQFIQVIVLPRESMDTIVFPITALHGDTLIAAGEKNKARWGDHFALTSVTSASGRPLLVSHGGKIAVLDGQKPDTITFRGMANSGPWEIRSLQTDAEKRDPATTPAALRLLTNLLYQKQ